MSNRFPWASLRSVIQFVASSLLLAACGGSAEINGAAAGKSGAPTDGNGSGGSANGGSTSGSTSGGSTSGGAAIGGSASGGSNNGGSAQGGNVNAGSGGACPFSCPAYLCVMGFRPVRKPGACCPTCEPDGNGGSAGEEDHCALVDCQAPVCGVGFKYQRSSGQCCGSCVPDNDAACRQGRSKYYDLQDALLSDPSATACKIDSDCVVLANHPLCGDQCASVPVNVRAAQSITEQLSQFEAAHCSTCKVVDIACEPSEPPTCADGQCVPFFE